ncbi:MAG: DUF4388 domain-containing protein [Acidobacteriota bacterium]
MAVEGTLEVFKLPEILQMISQQQKTGILTVQGEHDIIAVSFLKGQIVTVDSLNQTQEEGLSQLLIREGVLTNAQFARASAEHQSSGQRLLDLLVERNYVRRDALLKSLRVHSIRLLEQLLRWDKGDFKFYGGDEVPYEDGFVPIPVEEVLAHASQTATGAQRRPTGPVPGPMAVPSGPRPVPPLSGPAAATPAGFETAASTRPGLRVVRRDETALTVPEHPEETGPFRKMRVEAPPAEAVRRPALARVAAVLLALLMVAVLFLVPGAAVIPFPWQGEERLALAHEQRASLSLKIDRAAKTWFLLEGRFPERLSQLVQAGYLSPRDLVDPEGHPLQYSATEESYTLQPTKAGKPVRGAETTEAITGNFFLDPEFLTLPEESAAQPLVLLD